MSPEAAQSVLGTPLTRDATLAELLRRPDVRYAELVGLCPGLTAIDDPEVVQQLEIQSKYAGYIDRQHDEIALKRQHDELQLPQHFDYEDVRGLSVEVRQKLSQHRPATLGQASRLSGVTPAAISLLLVHLRRAGTR